MGKATVGVGDVFVVDRANLVFKYFPSEVDEKKATWNVQGAKVFFEVEAVTRDTVVAHTLHDRGGYPGKDRFQARTSDILASCTKEVPMKSKKTPMKSKKTPKAASTVKSTLKVGQIYGVVKDMPVTKVTRDATRHHWYGTMDNNGRVFFKITDISKPSSEADDSEAVIVRAETLDDRGFRIKTNFTVKGSDILACCSLQEDTAPEKLMASTEQKPALREGQVYRVIRDMSIKGLPWNQKWYASNDNESTAVYFRIDELPAPTSKTGRVKATTLADRGFKEECSFTVKASDILACCTLVEDPTAVGKKVPEEKTIAVMDGTFTVKRGQMFKVGSDMPISGIPGRTHWYASTTAPVLFEVTCLTSVEEGYVQAKRIDKGGMGIEFRVRPEYIYDFCTGVTASQTPTPKFSLAQGEEFRVIKNMHIKGVPGRTLWYACPSNPLTFRIVDASPAVDGYIQVQKTSGIYPVDFKVKPEAIRTCCEPVCSRVTEEVKAEPVPIPPWVENVSESVMGILAERCPGLKLSDVTTWVHGWYQKPRLPCPVYRGGYAKNTTRLAWRFCRGS